MYKFRELFKNFYSLAHFRFLHLFQRWVKTSYYFTLKEKSPIIYNDLRNATFITLSTHCINEYLKCKRFVDKNGDGKYEAC